MTCPGDIELSRALAIGADAELTAHLAGCEACRAAWDGAQAAIDLARELPVALPPMARREEVRTAVLAAAAGVAGRRARPAWRVPAVAGAAAAAVIGIVALSRTTPSPASSPGSPGHSHGTVRPRAAARYLASAGGPDEVVRLSDGMIDVDVEPLHPGERYRVVVGDAELEVRGTSFTVTAAAGHLVEVAVAHGRVDVTAGASAPATIGAGQTWRAAATVERPPAIVPPPRPQPSPEPPRLPSPSPPAHAAVTSRPHRVAAPRPDVEPAPSAIPAPAPTSPALAPAPPPAGRSAEEVSYNDAWAALRGGDYPRAASGFARIMLLAPDSPLVEDASFWHAVALARGKRSAEAMSAFRDFLDGHAGSARAGEASAMLGWLLIDARALDEAARRFVAATGDRDPAVRRSARAGLDALANRRR